MKESKLYKVAYCKQCGFSIGLTKGALEDLAREEIISKEQLSAFLSDFVETFGKCPRCGFFHWAIDVGDNINGKNS